MFCYWFSLIDWLFLINSYTFKNYCYLKIKKYYTYVTNNLRKIIRVRSKIFDPYLMSVYKINIKSNV